MMDASQCRVNLKLTQVNDDILIIIGRFNVKKENYAETNSTNLWLSSHSLIWYGKMGFGGFYECRVIFHRKCRKNCKADFYDFWQRGPKHVKDVRKDADWMQQYYSGCYAPLKSKFQVKFWFLSPHFHRVNKLGSIITQDDA